MTPYELSQCLKAVQGIAERLPQALTLEIDETANGAIEDATAKISRAPETCKQFEATFRAKEDELCKFIDDTFKRVKDAREAMRKRMDELPSITMSLDWNEISSISLKSRENCHICLTLLGHD